MVRRGGFGNMRHCLPSAAGHLRFHRAHGLRCTWGQGLAVLFACLSQGAAGWLPRRPLEHEPQRASAGTIVFAHIRLYCHAGPFL